jgi:hypothetical protein
MPRLQVISGEMTPPAGAIHRSAGPFDARWNPPYAVSPKVGSLPPKPPRQRRSCKTCDGAACMGQCKFSLSPHLAATP